MFTLLKGLGLGAGAMYLFDPEEGPSRREGLMKQVEGLVHEVENQLGQTSQGLGRQAGRLLDDAGQQAGALVGHDGPVDLNPAHWHPAAQLAVGTVGGVLALKILSRLPLTTLALGAAGLAMAAKSYSAGDDHGQGGRRHLLLPGEDSGRASRDVPFDRANFSHYGAEGKGHSGGRSSEGELATNDFGNSLGAEGAPDVGPTS